MTTAHRPTWHPAKGGSEQGGNRCFLPTKQYSAKDAPSHTKIKYRQEGQGTQDEVGNTDFKKKLLEEEINAILAREEPSEDSQEEVDDQELLEEFEKVKAERKEKERLKAVKKKQKGLLENNLLETAPGFSLKRKWNEETVFKNQARDEKRVNKTSINDTIRSQKHKDFLKKFIH